MSSNLGFEPIMSIIELILDLFSSYYGLFNRYLFQNIQDTGLNIFLSVHFNHDIKTDSSLDLGRLY